ncbi:DUF4405 domain-containing protein [Paenibacillus sp. GD4]|uniref:DUF4405 domain-containing protein n=1 Tax=Paenibacillus sp. GD4 TaxID=3068890 RepID=UPI0027969A30|nr:DUF4405 domain-containing protein [Paenibacillus sp. GD4]MDQ1910757.1 DUF4405 domain-containing protein [Paenibacillus sp. GD4]
MNKKKSYIKLTLDIVMGTTFALLFNKMVLGGLAFHEIAGTAIAFAFITHILLNLKFVQKITLRLFDKTLPGKTRLSYALNVILLITMAFVIVSGLLISRVVLPEFRYGNENWFKITHMGVSFLTLILIGVHIGLHWHWVMKVTNRLLNLKLPKTAARPVMTAAAAIVLLFGAYEVYTTGFLSKLQMLGMVVNASSAPAGHSGMQRPGAEAGAAEGAKPQRGSMEGRGAGARGEGMPGGSRLSPNAVTVAGTYFGIMAVFAGITYYADKWIGRRRRVAIE